MSTPDVVVVTGAGGMGAAVARRIGSGRTVILADASAAEMLSLGVLKSAGEDRIAAYILAKRGNQVRVRAAALAFNRRGARINTVSPGVIATAMAKAESETASGDQMMAMLDACGADRPGTPAEIAAVVAFLTGPDSHYIAGADILIDGGQAPWLRRHRVPSPE